MVLTASKPLQFSDFDIKVSLPVFYVFTRKIYFFQIFCGFSHTSRPLKFKPHLMIKKEKSEKIFFLTAFDKHYLKKKKLNAASSPPQHALLEFADDKKKKNMSCFLGY